MWDSRQQPILRSFSHFIQTNLASATGAVRNAIKHQSVKAHGIIQRAVVRPTDMSNRPRRPIIEHSRQLQPSRMRDLAKRVLSDFAGCVLDPYIQEMSAVVALDPGFDPRRLSTQGNGRIWPGIRRNYRSRRGNHTGCSRRSCPDRAGWSNAQSCRAVHRPGAMSLRSRSRARRQKRYARPWRWAPAWASPALPPPPPSGTDRLITSELAIIHPVRPSGVTTCSQLPSWLRPMTSKTTPWR